MAYAREAAGVAKGFDVFPSTEACLIEARTGIFAGCISATANLNADLCQQAWASGDAAALDTAVTIRKLFDGKPLVSGVKSTLAHIHNDAGLGAGRPAARAVSRPPTRPARTRAMMPRGRNGWPERGFDARSLLPLYKPAQPAASLAALVFQHLKRRPLAAGAAASERTRHTMAKPLPPAKPRA